MPLTLKDTGLNSNPQQVLMCALDGQVDCTELHTLFSKPMGKLVATTAIKRSFIRPGKRYHAHTDLWWESMGSLPDNRPNQDFVAFYKAYALPVILGRCSSRTILRVLKAGSPAESTDVLDAHDFIAANVPLVSCNSRQSEHKSCIATSRPYCNYAKYVLNAVRVAQVL